MLFCSSGALRLAGSPPSEGVRVSNDLSGGFAASGTAGRLKANVKAAAAPADVMRRENTFQPPRVSPGRANA